MSKDFIQSKIGSDSLEKARRQQGQLSYFTESSVQEDITTEYLNTWANRKYSSDDYFLNWVKNIFKTPNFLLVYKYLRYPLSTARLVNDNIMPQLKRVFHAEDSFFNYTINGEEVASPKEINPQEFDKAIFNELLFSHNNIIVTDLADINTPYTYSVDINNVVSIYSKHSVIEKIAFTASITTVSESGEYNTINGYLYIDSKEYAFYDSDYELVKLVPHDLGRCPADYISKDSFDSYDPLRKSIFTYVRSDMEEFQFLKTLQKMADANGAIPVATKLGKRDKTKNKDIKGKEGQPMAANLIGGQKAEFGIEVHGNSSGGDLQAGSMKNIAPIMKDGNTIDMDIVQNYFKFFHMPTESLKYIQERIQELQKTILESVIGVISNQNNTTQNELQVRSGFVSAEDKLRNFSAQLSRIRQRTDYNILALAYGKDNVSNQAFYGSKFFLETEAELYEVFKLSPNPIERRNTLLKISRTRNRFNEQAKERELILYHLLPYASDVDFKTAIDNAQVDSVTFQYQTRFNYWIGYFEADYGDIVEFWNDLGEISNSQKLIIINNLIIEIINQAIVPIQQTNT